MKQMLFALLAFLLFGVCSAHAEGYTQISQETAKEMMGQDDGHVVVDVRRQDEYDAGHIPGAILIPNESIGCDSPEALPDYDQIILIYCRSGNRSKQAAQKLTSMGYTQIYEFGGIITWTGDVVTTEEEQRAAMTVTIGEKTFSALLEDNDTARAFASLLPMELHMTELNGNEKYHYLMGPLPAASERVGHIEVGDIMLFGDDCVVVFYQSFDTPYSYTRIGKINDAAALADALGDGDVGVIFEQGGWTDGEHGWSYAE